MTLAYVKPGVSITEVVSPSFSPLLLNPTSIGIVGASQGFAPNTEVFVLADNAEQQLALLNVDITTLSVVDASNIISSPFVAGTDYTIDTSLLATTGAVSLKRAMQTTISNGQQVVVYFENSGSPVQSDAHSVRITLNNLLSVIPASVASGTVAASIVVQSEGKAPSGDYTISGNGGATPTITWQSGATVLRKFQQVYIDYTIASVPTTDAVFQLNNNSAVSLPANATVVNVKNAPGASTTVNAVTYQKGTGTTLDYIITGSGATTSIARSAGSTTMGVSNDKLTVRVTYQATPTSYWLPTRCFSQGDVENKYGPAFDSQGNILNELSFAANICFQNGATSVICQAVFTEGSPRTQTTGITTDWVNTLVNLRDIEDLNVLVPAIPQGSNDGFALTILGAIQNHVNYMAQNQNQYLIAICGEDSTSGASASEATLQAHGASVGSGAVADSMVLVSPASFSFPNPVNGKQSLMGGQFAAAGVAGMLARYSVQTSLTRKILSAIVSINDTRTEINKNADAQAGLLVIEAKRGRIQIRDAITTSQINLAEQQLNVVRAKHFLMANVVQAIDTQVIGQILLDADATFKVQLLITAVLQQMQNQGIIVSYDAIQVIRDPNIATALDVQFSYLPAYALNQVFITFSLDSSQGVTFDTTTNSNIQGI